MKERVFNLLNSQVQKEFESAYAYLDLAAFFESISLTGFSKWYYVQAREEEKHAMKIFRYIFDEDHKVQLMPLSPLKERPKNISAALNIALSQEIEITRLIHTIYRVALEEEDFATKNFLEWYVSEQVEEEVNARKMVEDYKLYGSTADGLFLLNQELSKRKGGCI